MGAPRFVVMALLGAGLAACSGGEPERSVQYYLDNPNARAAKLKQCAEQAAALSDLDGNCARAQQAEVTRRPVGPIELDSVVED